MTILRSAACIVLASSLLFAQADNTAKNKRDRTDPKKTADNQMNNESDLEITRKIRKMLTDDSSLSTYAKNVKIVSQNGKVTLRGPVNTSEEKQKVRAHAVMVAGEANVSDEIELVKMKSKKEL